MAATACENAAQTSEQRRDYGGLMLKLVRRPSDWQEPVVPIDFMSGATGLTEAEVNYLIDSGEITAEIRGGRRYVTLTETHRIGGLIENELLSQTEIAQIKSIVARRLAESRGVCTLRGRGDKQSPPGLREQDPSQLIWELRRTVRSLDFALSGMVRGTEVPEEPVRIEASDIDEVSRVATKVRLMVEELDRRQ